MAVISRSLMIFECEKNNVESLDYFEYFDQIQVLKLNSNKISQLEVHISIHTYYFRFKIMIF